MQDSSLLTKIALRAPQWEHGVSLLDHQEALNEYLTEHLHYAKGWVSTCWISRDVSLSLHEAYMGNTTQDIRSDGGTVGKKEEQGQGPGQARGFGEP